MTPHFEVDKGNARAYIHPDMTPATFRAAMVEAGIETQIEAARALGVTKGAVSRWLSGSRPIPPMAVMALRTVQDAPKTRRTRTRKTNTDKG